jgi:hypothetical protein
MSHIYSVILPGDTFYKCQIGLDIKPHLVTQGEYSGGHRLLYAFCILYNLLATTSQTGQKWKLEA